MLEVDELRNLRELRMRDPEAVAAAAARRVRRPLVNETGRLLLVAADHPARVEGEREIVRLDKLAFAGEIRGPEPEEGLEPLPSLVEP